MKKVIKITLLSLVAIAWMFLPFLVVSGVFAIGDYIYGSEDKEAEEFIEPEPRLENEVPVESNGEEKKNADNEEITATNGPYALVFNENLDPNVIVKDSTGIVRGGMDFPEDNKMWLRNETLLVNDTVLLFQIMGGLPDCVYAEEGWTEENQKRCDNETSKMYEVQKNYVGLWKYNIAKSEFAKLLDGNSSMINDKSINIKNQISDSNLVVLMLSYGESKEYVVIDVNTGKYDKIDLQ